MSEQPARYGDTAQSDSKAQQSLSEAASDFHPMPSKSERELLGWAQADRYAADLATLNARLVRARGLLCQVRDGATPAHKAAIDRFLAEAGGR